MPTYELKPEAWDDLERLSREQRRAFRDGARKFVADLRRGQIRAGLRLKRVQAHPGIWELTWAPDGRATFEYGPELRPGDPHIIWRRVGTHEIFREP